jgi:hypothetical protein
MSLKVKVDILVNNNSFLYIDLLQIGLYYLKTQIYYLEADSQVKFILKRKIMEFRIKYKKVWINKKRIYIKVVK